jgi:hypothetical protein
VEGYDELFKITDGWTRSHQVGDNYGAIDVVQQGISSLDRTCCEVAISHTAGRDYIPTLGLFPTGGRLANLKQSGTWESQDAAGEILYSKISRFGKLDIVVTLEACGGSSGSSAGSSRGHRLSIYHPPTCACFELSMPSRDTPCPEKVCASTAELEGTTFQLILAEAAFPHSLQAVVRAPGGQDFKCTLRDEDLFAMFPRSHKQLMLECVQELFVHGAISRGNAATTFAAEMPVGSNLVDPGHSTEVPVIRLAMPAAANAETKSFEEKRKQPAALLCTADFELSSLRLRLVLTRTRDTGSFTLGIGPEGGNASGAHLVHVTAPDGIGLHSEVRDIAGVRLLVFLLWDTSPRALRVAIVEPAANDIKQFVVLVDADDGAASAVPATLQEDPLRKQLLSTALESFVSVAPNFPPGTATAMLALHAPEGSSEQLRAAAVEDEHRIIHRGVRKLSSGQPVVLSIVREQSNNRLTRFRVLMYHPVSG